MAGPSRPANAASLLPADARNIFRTNSYHGTTSGFCRGYLQANIAAIPADLADDFAELCRRNRGPLPLLYCSRSAELGAPPLAEDSDIRRDIPRYRVYSQGRLVDDTLDLDGFSWENVVTFYLGCSFTAEERLLRAGIPLGYVEKGRNVAMYRSSVQLCRVGPFDCSMIVSMRPIKQNLLALLVSVTEQFPDAHGIPVHIGNPARIGIVSLLEDTIGDYTAVNEDEVPVFWCCGVTAGEAIAAAKPRLAFAHYPGSMFITDIQYNPRPQGDQPNIVPLAREGDPFFASIIAENKAALFPRLEKIILDDPGKRGVARLFQDGDLLKAVLALSHAKKVAVTTGFPCLTDYEVKEETDGLPGALALCQGLLALGKQVTLVSDHRCKALYSSCVDHAVSSGCLPSPVPVLSCDEARALQVQSTIANPAFDCLVAIERAGTYRTMKAVDISNFVDPIDDLFSGARSNPLVSTVGVGDGGNVLRMGKAMAAVKEFVDLGEQIACVIPTDFLIAAGVSNWAGYAISMGLYIASSCPLHWRYCKHGIDAESPPAMAVEQFLPNAEQTAGLLRHMNVLDICDSISYGLDQSVDGIPLQVHLDKLDLIRAVTLDM